MNHIFLTAGEPEEGMRLDAFIAARREEVTRSAIQRLIDAGSVQVNGKEAKKNTRLRAGDEIAYNIPEPLPLEAEAQEIPLAIVYEDGDLLVVNKPKGMVVHPAPGHAQGTLVNALLAHCAGSLSGIGGVQRPGILHRLDKDTSGLLIVAKNDAAHQHLAAQIQAHTFTRVYESVVYGNIKADTGTVNAPIARHKTDRKRMAVSERGRQAVTHYTVVERFAGFTHLRLRLETGRTHQIRVHMAGLGHPVAGDAVYGPKKVIARLEGQCLHARMIGFEHPHTGEMMEFESELPEYFTRFLKSLHQ